MFVILSEAKNPRILPASWQSLLPLENEPLDVQRIFDYI